MFFQNLPEHLITVTLKWVQVVPTVKERRRRNFWGWAGWKGYYFPQHEGKSRGGKWWCRGNKWQCLAWDSGPWNTNLRPRDRRPDGADHTRGQTTAKEAPETHSVLWWLCRGQQVWPHAKVLAVWREAIPLAGAFTLPERQRFVSSFRACREQSHVQGESAFQDTECPSFLLNNYQYSPYFSWNLSLKVPLARGAAAPGLWRNCGFPLCLANRSWTL